MLRWALGFFVLALIAALLGLGGVAAIAIDVAKFLFLIFVILLVISLFKGSARMKA